jgi:nitric oxide dioxygenase
MLENIYTTRPATWLHAARNGDVHAYRERLREISAIRGGELIRRVWYENPMPSDGSPGGDETNPNLYNIAKYHFKGRMDLKDPQLNAYNNILHIDNENAQYFMCGPTGFMETQKEALLSLGVSDNRIHWEGF